MIKKTDYYDRKRDTQAMLHGSRGIQSIDNGRFRVCSLDKFHKRLCL